MTDFLEILILVFVASIIFSLPIGGFILFLKLNKKKIAYIWLIGTVGVIPTLLLMLCILLIRKIRKTKDDKNKKEIYSNNFNDLCQREGVDFEEYIRNHIPEHILKKLQKKKTRLEGETLLIELYESKKINEELYYYVMNNYK